MPRSPNLLTLALAFVAARGVLPAQDAAEVVRRPTFVRVLDARGEALANATVFVSGGQPHLGAVAGETDALVVASDARGRAQCKLLPGLCYVAWAVGPADAEGQCLVSPVFGYFGAGALFELRCALASHRPRLVPCTGAAAWSDFGPLRYFVMTPYPGAEEELVLDAEGRLPLPPWPQAIVEVRTKDGQPLWCGLATTAELKIPPPQTIKVRVVDEHGAPIAGAAIRLRVSRQRPWNLDGLGGVVDGRFRDLAVTPASGCVAVQVPYPVDPFTDQSQGELLVFASVRGGPAVAGGVFSRSLYQNDRKVTEVAGGELLFPCKRTEPLVGQCRTVPAGTIAHLAAVCKLFSDRNSYTHDARSFVTTVDADGKFAFEDVPAELHSCRLTLMGPAPHGRGAPLFAAMSGRELPGAVAAPRPGRESPAGPNVTTLRLRVTDPGGGPARGVVAFLVPGNLNGVLLRDSLVRVPLDAAGASTVSIVQGEWIVMVISAAGFAATKTDVTTADMVLPVAMQPLATMKLRLLDASGQPIAGARVVAQRSSTHSSGDPVEAMLQSVVGPARTTWGTLLTDADGAVTIPFVPVNGVTNHLALTWDNGTTETFTLEANEAPLELRVR